MGESDQKQDKSERRFSKEQYEMLLRCSEKKDMTEWNQWRKEHPDEDVLLESADLDNTHLEGSFLNSEVLTDPKTGKFMGFRALAHLEGAHLNHADLRGADLKNARLERAQLLNARLQGANLEYVHLEAARLEDAALDGAKLCYARLKGTRFTRADLQRAQLIGAHSENARFRFADLRTAGFQWDIVDGSTLFFDCKVDRETDFRGVGLDNARIDSATKQLLEYNIRRMNWGDWYKGHRFLRWPVWWFWSISDYGLRTWRIILWFFGLATGFAFIYWLRPSSVMVNQVVGDIRGFWHALYFSVVTMTTLGFGDIAANPDSWLGQTLLMLQVILGYVLLGALVTRFAVLFTAGGPAGRFSKEARNSNHQTGNKSE